MLPRAFAFETILHDGRCRLLLQNTKSHCKLARYVYIYIYIYTHIYIHIHTYIYIYIYTARSTSACDNLGDGGPTQKRVSNERIAKTNQLDVADHTHSVDNAAKGRLLMTIIINI